MPKTPRINMSKRGNKRVLNERSSEAVCRPFPISISNFPLNTIHSEYNKTNNKFNDTKIGKVDSGAFIPNRELVAFKANPPSMIDIRLNPIEYGKSILFKPTKIEITRPGTNAKKVNTRTCLNIPISNKIEIFINN